MSHQNDDENLYNESYDQIPDDMNYTDSDDLDISDAEWSEDTDGDMGLEDQNPTQAPKKKSSLTTIIVVLVAVLGFLGYMLMGGGNKNVNSVPPTSTETASNNLASLREAPIENNTAQPMPSATINATQGLMDEPQVLDQPITPTTPPVEAVAPTVAAPELPAQTMTAPESAPALSAPLQSQHLCQPPPLQKH